jgi:hypothetical protein
MLKAGGGAMTETVTASLAYSPPAVPVMVVEPVAIAAEALAVSVSVELALPLAAGVTVAGEKLAVTPAGSAPMLSDTGELNPFWLATYTGMVVEAPCATEKAVEVVPTVYEGALDSRNGAELVSEPEAPTIEAVNDPVAVVGLETSVSTEVAELFAPGVSVAGAKLAVTPAGRFFIDSATVPAKLSRLVTVTIFGLFAFAVLVVPAWSTSAVSVEPTVKLPCVEVTVSETVVAAFRLPLVPVIVTT